MIAFLQKWVTTEGLLAVVGGAWFAVSAIFPVIPAEMPIPALIPGLTAITPGLLVLLMLFPIVLKMVIPGKTPFVGTGSIPVEVATTIATKENKDA